MSDQFGNQFQPQTFAQSLIAGIMMKPEKENEAKAMLSVVETYNKETATRETKEIVPVIESVLAKVKDGTTDELALKALASAISKKHLGTELAYQ